jgi:hypothetical protein
MRPDTPDDPAVKSVEEFSDAKTFELAISATMRLIGERKPTSPN